jgi:hypothetical protein
LCRHSSGQPELADLEIVSDVHIDLRVDAEIASQAAAADDDLRLTVTINARGDGMASRVVAPKNRRFTTSRAKGWSPARPVSNRALQLI